MPQTIPFAPKYFPVHSVKYIHRYNFQTFPTDNFLITEAC